MFYTSRTYVFAASKNIIHLKMDFTLTEEHKVIRHTAADFAQQQLKPGVIERDSKGEYPTEQVKEMVELRFMGIMVDEKYGGSGITFIF
jgi:alkylation response protein AidB-like acyl-CoA dehydrogenase